MQILTTGRMMEDSGKYLDINRIFNLICYMFWIFSLAEGNTISEVFDSKVILQCKNESNSTLRQLTWKRNGVVLFSFVPKRPLYSSQEALSLNINMSQSESQLYALVIERARESHTGNYTCDTITTTGVQDQKWELIITGHEDLDREADKLVIAVAAIVPCVCCLIFILALTILQRVRKERPQNRSPTAGMGQEEDIYENCLESDRRRRLQTKIHTHPQQT